MILMDMNILFAANPSFLLGQGLALLSATTISRLRQQTQSIWCIARARCTDHSGPSYSTDNHISTINRLTSSPPPCYKYLLMDGRRSNSSAAIAMVCRFVDNHQPLSKILSTNRMRNFSFACIFLSEVTCQFSGPFYLTFSVHLRLRYISTTSSLRKLVIFIRPRSWTASIPLCSRQGLGSVCRLLLLYANTYASLPQRPG
jgi:hypothetical protein